MRDRVKCVIHEMRRFGVSEVSTVPMVFIIVIMIVMTMTKSTLRCKNVPNGQVFEVEDLMELKNVPKVCFKLHYKLDKFKTLKKMYKKFKNFKKMLQN